MAFGAPPEVRTMQGEGGSTFEIWPENVETVAVFLRLQTQWSTAPMGGVIGLNYQGVKALFDILETPNRVDVFDGLQVMERAVLSVLNKRED